MVKATPNLFESFARSNASNPVPSGGDVTRVSKPEIAIWPGGDLKGSPVGVVKRKFSDRPLVGDASNPGS